MRRGRYGRKKLRTKEILIGTGMMLVGISVSLIGTKIFCERPIFQFVSITVIFSGEFITISGYDLMIHR